MEFNNWMTISIYEQIHVVPEDDKHEHSLNFNKCSCGVTIQDSTDIHCILHHKPFDDRLIKEIIH